MRDNCIKICILACIFTHINQAVAALQAKQKEGGGAGGGDGGRGGKGKGRGGRQAVTERSDVTACQT